ncbi:MAG: hypothetical protein ACRC35_03705 [Angustibacter sp.]
MDPGEGEEFSPIPQERRALVVNVVTTKVTREVRQALRYTEDKPRADEIVSELEETLPPEVGAALDEASQASYQAGQAAAEEGKSDQEIREVARRTFDDRIARDLAASVEGVILAVVDDLPSKAPSVQEAVDAVIPEAAQFVTAKTADLVADAVVVEVQDGNSTDPPYQPAAEPTSSPTSAEPPAAEPAAATTTDTTSPPPTVPATGQPNGEVSSAPVPAPGTSWPPYALWPSRPPAGADELGISGEQD